MSKLPNIGIALRDGRDGIYNVAVSYNQHGKTRYIRTEHSALKEQWEEFQIVKGNLKLVSKNPKMAAMKIIEDAIQAKIAITDATLKKANVELSLEAFRAAWNGEKFVSDKTWIALLDKHVELNTKKYSLGNKRLYEGTRAILVKMQKGGENLDVTTFDEVKKYEDFQELILKYAKLGKVTLGMKMSHIKAIAKTGFDKKCKLEWIPNDSFAAYKKPTPPDIGTVPNTVEQFRLLRDHDVASLTPDPRFRTNYEMARDFWIWMVTCGGMEVRSWAKLTWKEVYSEHFQFIRAKTENTSTSPAIVMSTNSTLTKAIFEKYGVKGGKYVFPFLTEEMTPVQQETAIFNLCRNITKNLGRIAKKLDIYPRPTCKRARPTFAVISEARGMSLLQQKNMMGHKKISTTEIYMAKMPTKKLIDTSESFSNDLATI